MSSGFDTFVKLSGKSLLTSICSEEEDDEKTEKETKDAKSVLGFLRIEELFLTANCISSESFFSRPLFLISHPHIEINCPPPDSAKA